MFRLIKSILYEGQEFDLSLLRKAYYIESIHICSPAPLLTLFLDDDKALTTSFFNVTHKGVFTVYFDDTAEGGEEGFEEEFVVSKIDNAPYYVNETKVVKITLETSLGFYLAQFVPATQSFISKPIESIIKSVLSGFSVDLEIDTFPQIQDFILSNQTRLNFIKSLAREIGAYIFYQRGVFFVKDKKSMHENPFFRTYSDNFSSDFIILDDQMLSSDETLNQLTKKRFGYSIKEGLIDLEINNEIIEESPYKLEPYDSKDVLRNLNLQTQTVNRLHLYGDSALKAGLTLELLWKSHVKGVVLDEVKPGSVLISTIQHIEQVRGDQRDRYQCICEGAILRDLNEGE